MAQDAAEKVRDRAEPLVDDAKSAAQEAGERLKPESQAAAENVRDTAARSAEHVKDASKDQTQDLKQNSQQVAHHEYLVLSSTALMRHSHDGRYRAKSNES